MNISKIMILGAGLMGRGIAQVAAQGGYQVYLYDICENALESALVSIKKNLAKGVEKGKISEKAKEETLARISLTGDLDKAVGTQMVIEAVPEDINIKWEVYKKVDQICPLGAIIATNTSALSITELGSVVKRPDRFIGMHFFNPVHLMKLVEIVRGLETSDETCRVAFEVSKRMGKEPVEVNEFPGFVTTRMNALIGNEAFKMLEQGVASARDIDKAIKLGLNHPMGPFEMADLVGLDTRLRILEYLSSTLGERFRPSPLLVKYVKAGRLGRKVGRGVYEYEEANK